jgi:hypothetical protein
MDAKQYQELSNRRAHAFDDYDAVMSMLCKTHHMYKHDKLFKACKKYISIALSRGNAENERCKLALNAAYGADALKQGGSTCKSMKMN